MSRSANGIYTLPENPFVPHSRMVSSVMNSNFSDIANALTQSLPTNGIASMTGPIKGSNGSPVAPSFTFDTDTDTGWYWSSSNVFLFVVGGLPTLRFNANQSVTRFGNTIFNGAVTYADFTYIATVTVSQDLNITDTQAVWSGQSIISSIGQFQSTVNFSGSVYLGSFIEIKASTTAGYLQMTEISAPTSAAANSIRLYIKDTSASSIIEWKDENGVAQNPGKILLQADSASNVTQLDIALTAYTSRFNNFSFYIIQSEVSDSGSDIVLRFSQDGGATFLATTSVYQFCIMGADTGGIAPLGNTSGTTFPGGGTVGTAGLAEILLYNVNNVSALRSKAMAKGSGGVENTLGFTTNMWRTGGMITATNISAVRFLSSSTIRKFRYLLHGWS
jgi:hypothetical protein